MREHFGNKGKRRAFFQWEEVQSLRVIFPSESRLVVPEKSSGGLSLFLDFSTTTEFEHSFHLPPAAAMLKSQQAGALSIYAGGIYVAEDCENRESFGNKGKRRAFFQWEEVQSLRVIFPSESRLVVPEKSSGGLPLFLDFSTTTEFEHSFHLPPAAAMLKSQQATLAGLITRRPSAQLQPYTQ